MVAKNDPTRAQALAKEVGAFDNKYFLIYTKYLFQTRSESISYNELTMTELRVMTP